MDRNPKTIEKYKYMGKTVYRFAGGWRYNFWNGEQWFSFRFQNQEDCHKLIKSEKESLPSEYRYLANWDIRWIDQVKLGKI